MIYTTNSVEALHRQFRKITKVCYSSFGEKYPGLCALQFETVTNIIVSHVIGWNEDRKVFFGYTEAYCSAAEEQGTGTLHMHFAVWLKK